MFLNGWNVSSELLNQIYFTHSVIFTFVGLVMNTIVLAKMRKLSRRNSEQYYNGIGILLFSCSMFDTFSMISSFLQFVNLQVSFKLQDLVCKIISFTSHTAYTMGMFSLVIMSLLRWISIRRPLEYRFSVASSILGVNWNVYHRTRPKFMAPSRCHLSKWTMHAKLFCNFADSKASRRVLLCCRIESPFSDPMLQIVINRPKSERKKSLNRFLIITIACIILNFPEILLRVCVAINAPFLQAIPPALLVLTKALYFSQFAFRSFYLATFVYDRSVLSKTNSSRQLSISFKQRLEESSHMLRERSATMSYRPTTPLPKIERNSSCDALNLLVVPGKYSF
ncbi:G protein-coupled receptor [Aphelenchoides bicaudatus]|nr:G protein-coupled receptor [Aphelenchoides bicaudatus]